MTTKKTITLLVLALLAAPLISIAFGAPIVAPAQHVIRLSSNPATGNGRQAAIGQLGVFPGGSSLHLKVGTAATAWEMIASTNPAFGDGTADTIAMWTTTGTPGVLADSPITITAGVPSVGDWDVTGTGLGLEATVFQGWTYKKQAADQDVTNAADQDSNTFTVTVSAGQTYSVRLRLQAGGSNAANDYEFRFAVAAGTMTGRGWANRVDQADAANIVLVNVAAAATSAQIGVGAYNASAAAFTPIEAEYTFIPSNNTTFKVQFGNLVTGVGIVSRTGRGSEMWHKWLL